MSAKINSFYRVWFTTIDPVMLFFLAYTIVFTPDLMMDSLIPSSMSKPNPDHAFLLHQLAALYGFLAIMLSVLLRATSDIKLWNIVIGAVLAIDAVLLTSLYVSLQHQGRLDMSQWRSQDWFNWIITGFVAVVRIAFLRGVGVSIESEPIVVDEQEQEKVAEKVTEKETEPVFETIIEIETATEKDALVTNEAPRLVRTRSASYYDGALSGLSKVEEVWERNLRFKPVTAFD